MRWVIAGFLSFMGIGICFSGNWFVGIVCLALAWGVVSLASLFDDEPPAPVTVTRYDSAARARAEALSAKRDAEAEAEAEKRRAEKQKKAAVEDALRETAEAEAARSEWDD